MKWYKYSFLVCCFISSASFAQPTFNSIDTLLAKNFEAVNLEDSVYYISLLNHSAIYKGKNAKNKADSLKVLKPFSEAFFDMMDELTDFAGNDDIEVKYESYKSHNTKEHDAKITGKIMLQVNLLINNTFTVTVPFMITGYNGKYAIENPMMVMFADN
ncbi:MAG: hypothetical protein V4506_03605 [Bacteroidota bacterium]